MPGPHVASGNANPATASGAVGGPEALARHHAVDGERAAEADARPQALADAVGDGTHRVSVIGRRVPERGGARVEEFGSGPAQGYELDGSEDGDAVAEHHAVD